MRHRPLAAVAAVALTAGTALLVATPVHAAAPATCQGKPVTIVASTTVTTGTEGDDVVAMEPDGWTQFDALGGNDTVCLTIPADIVTDHYGGRTTTGTLDAGPGDDSVTNLTPAGSSQVSTTVVLGLGRDVFAGADVGEVVFADLDDLGQGDPDAVDPALVGDQSDVVTGAATVHSTAPNGAANADRITFGTRGGYAVMSGPMGPQALLDFSAAADAQLDVRSPRRLGVPSAGDVVVDNRARAVTSGGAILLAWSGDVQTFVLGSRGEPAAGPAVSFVGTDAVERVTFADVLVGDVDLGGGDDVLDVESWNIASVPRSANGGSGRDLALIHSMCRSELRVVLDASATCDGHSGPFAGFRDVLLGGSDVVGARTSVVGTDRSERLAASGHAVVVRGGGGRDDIEAGDSWSVRVWAGAGRDRVSATGDDVVVNGEGGADRIVLEGFADFIPPRHHRSQQVARGGPGADRLVGTSDISRDRLIGGAGRDRADGGDGGRDYCVAEVTRRCERP